MPRVVVFLKESAIKDLKKLAKNSNKSLSNTISELVDIGYQIKQYQDTEPQTPPKNKKTDLSNKHSEYLLLKTLAITADIYRCVRNENSKYEKATANDALKVIDINTRDFIKKNITRT